MSRLANALKALGVRKGDRVNIYLGMVPELPMALLACSRIGAAHSVVFGGFSADSLRDRINDAEAKVLITGDGAWRRGAIVPLKETADTAVAECPSIEKVLVLRRTEQDVPWTEGRDVWWHELVAGAVARVRARTDGRRRPPLSAVHERHHGQAQGHHAHDRRLPHAGGVDPPQRLRPRPRPRRLLVRRRRRLGHRPLVHRLRAAHEPRRRASCTRARRTIPDKDRLWADHRALQA